jgi:hypothetical protein
MSDDDRERAREALEDAVYRCLEAGMTPEAVVAEVQYAIKTAEDPYA